LGTETDLTWVTPLPLWTGILAGPVAWAFDLTASYALVKWNCMHPGPILHLISLASLVCVIAGGAVSAMAMQQTARDLPTDGGHPRQRAHFMAVLGLTMSALFALTIVAGAIPRWVLDACH
jgi:hypothetical protein